MLLIPSMVRSVLVLAVAACGLLVLVVSFAGGASTEPGVETPQSSTAEEITGLTDADIATQVARQRSVRDDLIESGASVADMRRSETTGMSGRKAVTLDEARQRSTEMIVGTVEEQFLELGRHPTQDRDITVLVSIVEDEDSGRKVRLTQQAHLIVAGSGTYLGYQSEPPLDHGERYAVFAVPTADSTFELLLGQVYEVAADETLKPLMRSPANRELEGANLTTAEAMFR